MFSLARNNSPYQIEYRYEKQSIQGLLVDCVPKNASVVDMGCGGGGMGSLLIQQNGCSVLGVEPDAGAAETARSRGLETHVGSIEDFVQSNKSKFDGVLFMDVLEHLFDPLTTLNSVRPLLNDTGRVYVSVPNVAHWIVRFKLLFGYFNYTDAGTMDYTHIRWFTKDSLKQLVHESDFVIEQFLFSPGVWHVPYRIVPNSLRIPLLGGLANLFPGLFASQFFMVLRPK